MQVKARLRIAKARLVFTQVGWFFHTNASVTVSVFASLAPPPPPTGCSNLAAVQLWLGGQGGGHGGRPGSQTCVQLCGCINAKLNGRVLR